MIFDSWLRLMPQLNGLCQLVKPFGWILERKKDPNPKQLKVARRENSMHTKTLETIKRHVAALPIQTGRSRCWSSNGSGVSLRSVGIGLGSLRCSWWSSSRWLEDAELRRNQVERTKTMDLTTVDRVIQGPDAGVISDSMKTHQISTVLDS